MNAMQRVKFGLGLMFPQSEHLEVLRQMFAVLNQANRQLFPDADALREALAGTVFNVGQNPDEESSKPPSAIAWANSIADDFLAAIPKAVQYPSEVAPHGKNWDMLSAQLIGIDLKGKAITTGELAAFVLGKRDTAMAYLRSEIANHRLEAYKLIEGDPQSPLVIDVEVAKRWLLKPRRGSRSTKPE